MIDVTAAVIARGGRVLLCRRPEGKRCAGLWEFPGGKAEPGETLEGCLARECREELDVELRVGRALACVARDGLRITFFAAQIARGEPQLREHSALAWVTPEQARTYALCPSDAQMLKQTAPEALLAGQNAPKGAENDTENDTEENESGKTEEKP